MATGKLTKSIVDALGPGEMFWDTSLSGFGVRRQTKAPHYLVRYYFAGRQRFMTIGRHGSPWTVETARRQAKQLLGQIASGTDPQVEKAKAAIASAETFGAIIDVYLRHKQRHLKPKSFGDTERHLRQYAQPLHRLPLAEINRRAIAALLGKIETAGVVTRNRVRSSLSPFFAWCIAEGLIELNPVQGTARAVEGNGRERVLTDAEIAKLWAALGDGHFAEIVRLLLLTGQRRNEIGKLTWGEIDLVRRMIILPAMRTKNGRQHELPLSQQALAILQHQPRRNTSPFLFSNIRGFNSWDKAKARLDKRLRIADWTLHDLRRTCATGMAELGVQRHIIEAVLNHVSGHKAGVAGIYNRARYEGEMRGALQRWADHVEALIVGPREQPVPTGLMERAFAVARGSKIVPEEDLANLARHLTPLKRA
jgi:integrase